MANTDSDADVIHVIQSAYHYRDQDNHPKTDETLLDDEGWFADTASAAARCDQLNAQNRTHYDTQVAADEREHAAKIRKAEQLNREAAAIRAGGMTKTDVPVPSAFVPETFEKFLSRSSHTSYEPLEIRRSDHDGIARAEEPAVATDEQVVQKTSTEENATGSVAPSTA